MANDDGSKEKKGFSSSFFIFLLLILLLVVMVQNFTNIKAAKVAFSYQAEHLVNLGLLDPEDSRKVAVNDSLVTFTGKFRDQLPEESKKRYRFLELLQQHTHLSEEMQFAEEDLDVLQLSIAKAADWYLHLAGIPLPKGGYVVVSPSFDTPGRRNQVVITQLSQQPLTSIGELQRDYSELLAKTTAAGVRAFGLEEAAFVRNLRSPVLGIGDEALKGRLKALNQTVVDAAARDEGQQELAIKEYGQSLKDLGEIVALLDVEQDSMRLLALRSVRRYKDAMTQYQQLSAALEQNQAQLDKAERAVTDVVWFFNNKELSTRALIRQDRDAYQSWFEGAREEWENFSANRGLYFKVPDQHRNLVLDREFVSEEPAPNYMSYLFTLLPILMVVFLLYFMFSRQARGGGIGNSAMSFGKSPAKMLNKSTNKITFKDVAGIDEAKEELQEIVDFLKSPSRFTALGARIPKGVLCIGPPGTGKTLIAKAVAGEADRPFFSISGSDFVEMFVGVGASRIRDMFDQGRKNAPCIIFIDEIDAVGRHRGGGFGGGHDEREQTLNQLLVEMDGFESKEGVILMAATNRPDVLDKALLRPGRFDRRVVFNLPDIKGRYEILKVSARKIKMDPDLDLMLVARASPGASGADLDNILNEAALIAARRGRSAVTLQEALEANDKVRYGKERRSMELDQHEKKLTAYHESGHAIVALMVEFADPVDKVTVIPRGMSLGATFFLPRKDRVTYWRKELADKLAVLMGGRAAEEIFLGDISSGAQGDIAEASRLARAMICEWGMSNDLGLVAYDTRGEQGQYVGMSYPEKNYSEATAKYIDDEVKKISDIAYSRAKQILTDNKEKVELMTQMLIEFETLDAEDAKAIADGQWDSENKRSRVKAKEEKLRQSNGNNTPPPPPPLPVTTP